MCVAKQRIAAREGTREECELLGEPAGSPLLTMERLTHDDSGRAVEWARHAYRPDRYAFTVTLVGRGYRLGQRTQDAEKGRPAVSRLPSSVSPC